MLRPIPETHEDGLGNVQIKTRCVMCSQNYTFKVLLEQYRVYRSGAMIQDAFPDLAPGERELLINGICDPCWDFTFAREEPEYAHGA